MLLSSTWAFLSILVSEPENHGITDFSGRTDLLLSRLRFDGFLTGIGVRRLGLGLPGVAPTLLAQKIKKVKPLRLSGGEVLPILAVLTGF